MSKRNKRTPSMAAARSSRAGARIGKSVPASKFRKASFMEGLRFFVRENVRMMLIFAGATTVGGQLNVSSAGTVRRATVATPLSVTGTTTVNGVGCSPSVCIP